MNEPTRYCPQCGNATLPGAPFCAYCGTAQPKAPPRPSAAASRDVPVPDRKELQGPCTLLAAGADEVDVRAVGRLVAEAVRRPLSDVTRDLRASKGILATDVPAPQAVALAERLEAELRAPVLVLPKDAVVALPAALRMRQAHVTAEGLRCEAYSWDATEPVEVTWDQVFLISCARLELQEAVEPREEPTHGSTLFRRLPNLLTVTHHEFLLDIVLFNPWRRLRLDQNTVAFSMTAMGHDPQEALGSLYRCAVNLDRFAAGVPRNGGLELLAAGAAESRWQSLTFHNKRDFDLYTFWLIQLVRYGQKIPL